MSLMNESSGSFWGLSAFPQEKMVTVFCVRGRGSEFFSVIAAANRSGSVSECRRRN
jgi:hypothetical protein